MADLRAKSGQEAQVETTPVETTPEKKSKWQSIKDTAKQIVKDLNTAVTAGSAPLGAETKRDQVRTEQALAEKGLDPKLASGYNGPTQPDQVERFIENPLTFNPDAEKQRQQEEAYAKAQEAKEAPSAEATPTVEPTPTAKPEVPVAKEEAPTEDNTLSPQEKIAEDSAAKQWQIAQKVLDENNPYKSGADYLQALWGSGKKGKAQAVANVLGNIFGAVGKGVAGQDYTSDWQKFRDEYTAQSQARRAEAAQNAQDMVNTVAQNKEARAELINALNQAKANGAALTPQDLAAINSWQTATTPSSALNKAIAAIVNKVSDEGLLPATGSLLTGGKSLLTGGKN